MLLKSIMASGQLSQQWHFYLPLMIGSFLLMIPFLTLSERKGHIKAVFLGSILVTGLCQGILAWQYETWVVLCALMFLYFVGFNILEASLPSLVSRQASPESKGTAMGVYSSSQFLGIFAGGAMAGVIYKYAGSQGIFLANGLVSLFWFVVACYLKPHCYEMTLLLPLPQKPIDLTKITHQLQTLPGVLDVVFSTEEKTLYVRVNKSLYAMGSAEHLMGHTTKTKRDD